MARFPVETSGEKNISKYYKILRNISLGVRCEEPKKHHKKNHKAKHAKHHPNSEKDDIKLVIIREAIALFGLVICLAGSRIIKITLFLGGFIVLLLFSYLTLPSIIDNDTCCVTQLISAESIVLVLILYIVLSCILALTMIHVV